MPGRLPGAKATITSSSTSSDVTEAMSEIDSIMGVSESLRR